jgi:hypothetical protein
MLKLKQRSFVPTISITSKDIQKELSILGNLYYNNDDGYDISNYESNLLIDNPICSAELLEKLDDRLGNLDADKLKSFTKKPSNDVLKATACTIQAAVYLSPFSIGDKYLNLKIKNYIKDLRTIGAQSVNGYAFIANLKNGSDFFVVKTSKYIENDSELIHELVVGLYGTNNLRAKIPNFAYVYGGFKCSPPYIDKNGKVTSWCTSNKGKQNYIMYENINNSVTTSSFLETCSGEEFVNIYLQILYSLRTAQKDIDFTHYDLHYDNVLIKSTEGNKLNVIKYDTENGEEYITTNHVAIIIDYGYSHIKHENIHLGFNALKYIGISADESWIFYDLYKFLLFSMEIAKKYKNKDVFKAGRILFKFFNTSERLENAIKIQRENLYSFPKFDKTKQLNIDDFSNYIRNKTKFKSFSFKNGSNLEVFGQDSSKISKEEVYHESGIDPDLPVKTTDDIVKFFLMEKKFRNTLNENERYELTNNFKSKYPVAIYNLVENIKSLIESINNNIKSITFKNKLEVTTVDEFDNKLSKDYDIFINTGDNFYQLLYNIIVFKNTYETYSKSFQFDSDTVESINTINKKFYNSVNDFDVILPKIQVFFSKIKKLVHTYQKKMLSFHWKNENSLTERLSDDILRIISLNK